MTATILQFPARKHLHPIIFADRRIMPNTAWKRPRSRLCRASCPCATPATTRRRTLLIARVARAFASKAATSTASRSIRSTRPTQAKGIPHAKTSS